MAKQSRALAERVAEKGLQALSNDIMVIRKHYPSEKGEDVDIEAHINPLGIGLGLLGAAVFAAFAFGRVAVPSLLGGEVELYKGPLFDEWDDWTRIRRTMHTARLLIQGAQTLPDLFHRFDAAVASINGLGGIDDNRKQVLIDSLLPILAAKYRALGGSLTYSTPEGEKPCPPECIFGCTKFGDHIVCKKVPIPIPGSGVTSVMVGMTPPRSSKA